MCTVSAFLSHTILKRAQSNQRWKGKLNYHEIDTTCFVSHHSFIFVSVLLLVKAGCLRGSFWLINLFAIITAFTLYNCLIFPRFCFRKRKQMASANNGRSLNEMQLFHGTTSDVLNAICKNGFDWRLCGTHGTVYGQGKSRCFWIWGLLWFQLFFHWFWPVFKFNLHNQNYVFC